jgi:hypothetical protein
MEPLKYEDRMTWLKIVLLDHEKEKSESRLLSDLLNAGGSKKTSAVFAAFKQTPKEAGSSIYFVGAFPRHTPVEILSKYKPEPCERPQRGKVDFVIGDPAAFYFEY